MRDCYIRCLKNGNPECSSPCDQPTDHPDKTHSKEPPAGETVTSTANTTKNTTTNTLGKHSIISPREIEACTYYPELKSLLSGYLIDVSYIHTYILSFVIHISHTFIFTFSSKTGLIIPTKIIHTCIHTYIFANIHTYIHKYPDALSFFLLDQRI